MKKGVLCAGRWLVLRAAPHRDAQGVEKPWEFVSRTGTGRAVAVIARLRDPDRLVLVKQWRPPMNAWTLEFPAGLVEPGDSPEATALRELEEETGFTGEVVSVGPEVCSSPGMTDETVAWVEVAVGRRGPARPQSDERIETLVVPADGLAATIERLGAQGVRVEGKLYGYARGLAAAR